MPTVTLSAADGILKFSSVSITEEVAQFRVSIPATHGVTFPLAVTYSSRTELVKTDKGFWQGHAGVSYDLGALKQLLLRK